MPVPRGGAVWRVFQCRAPCQTPGDRPAISVDHTTILYPAFRLRGDEAAMATRPQARLRQAIEGLDHYSFHRSIIQQWFSKYKLDHQQIDISDNNIYLYELYRAKLLGRYIF